MLRGSDAGGTQTQTVQVASNVDRSGAVLMLGGGLFVANMVFGSGSNLVPYLTGQSKTVPSMNWGQQAFLLFGIFLLLLLAKTGEVGGNFAVLLLAAAWVVWLLNQPQAVAKLFGQSSSSGSSSSSSGSVGGGGSRPKQ